MARAKRTDRAEARRRYRAAVHAAEAGESTEIELPVAAAPATRRPRSSSEPRAAAAQPSGQRMGFLDSMRASVRPANVKEDLRAFPSIARTSRAIWLPALLVVVTGVLMLIPALSSNQIVQLAAQLLVVPPPMIPAFLAGMLATRAAWLCGGVIGALAGIIFAIYALTTPLSETVPASIRSEAMLYGLVVSPVFGIGIGAFAGFYRRFLRFASPAKQGGGRPQQSRRR